MTRLAFAAFVAVLSTGVAEAQLGRSDESIQVHAAVGEYWQNECRGLWTGDVVATQGEARLTSDKLTMLGSRGAVDCETERLIAEGRVRYSAPKMKIGADKGEYDQATDTIVFTGDVIMTNGDRGVIRATQLVYNVALETSRITAGDSQVHMIIPPASRR